MYYNRTEYTSILLKITVTWYISIIYRYKLISKNSRKKKLWEMLIFIDEKSSATKY